MTILRGSGADPRASHAAALYELPVPFALACKIPDCNHPIAVYGKALCCMPKGEIDNALLELAQLAAAAADTVESSDADAVADKGHDADYQIEKRGD